jgi:hypothetical protein
MLVWGMLGVEGVLVGRGCRKTVVVEASTESPLKDTMPLFSLAGKTTGST